MNLTNLCAGVVTAATISIGAAGGASAASVFADTATTSDTSSFGSGILTGAADGGGHWLGTTSDPPAALGTITWGFSGGLIDGIGADIGLYEVASSANETFDLLLSADGINFTLIGGFNATNTLIDIAGAFAGTFNFVRVTNTSTSVSADFDTAEGFHMAPAVVPLPASGLLLVAGLGGLSALRRRKKS